MVCCYSCGFVVAALKKDIGILILQVSSVDLRGLEMKRSPKQLQGKGRYSGTDIKCDGTNLGQEQKRRKMRGGFKLRK